MFEPCLQVKEFMEDFEGKWLIAGGWAIDLHIGEETRDHEDIEVAVFREDLLSLSEWLQNWRTFVVDRSRMVEDHVDESLDKHIHEIHAHREEAKLEILLNMKSKEQWKFRRDPQISFPLNRMNLQSERGIPYLNPEIVLLFKAKNTQVKDEQDFQSVFPYLNEQQKEWLKQALIIHQPEHHWLESLLY
ncbi:nucleotidyltransferase domain-containing protein [Halobacillus sp. B23F22_1]|uniref:nucleotidyltransferase domain-containing protein n=1 Tax=Halobacillus sp. B23F22_1 TaxID=3459514 RepID=UPI00373FB2AB